jgi:NitT/TauT family transport system permease protein
MVQNRIGVSGLQEPQLSQGIDGSRAAVPDAREDPGEVLPSARTAAAAIRRVAIRVITAIVAIAVLVLIWQLVCVIWHVDPELLPRPVTVFQTLQADWSLLLTNAEPTIEESVAGFALGSAIGVPLGYVISVPSPVKSFLTTSMLAAQIFPKIAIAPLFIVWFGFGMGPKIFFIFLMTFFPVAMNALAGFASVPGEIRELGSVLGLGWWGRLRKLELPWSLPSIFTGMKISGSFTVIGAIVYEYVGSNSGLGYLILQSSTNLDARVMFAAFIVVTCIGFLIYGAVAFLEVLVIPWHISKRRAQ